MFEGKTAVITGAARGIGQAIAWNLARGGADIVLCDIKEDWLAETAEGVKKAGRKVWCFELNVTDADAVQKAFNDIADTTGRIDILVNNAGITRDGLLMRMSEEDWDAVLSVNLKGTFACTKAVSRIMMKQRSGSIVNIASIIGLMGNAGQANYAASKGGVISFTKSVAKELASRNIRVNAVAPGFISSKMTDALSEDVRQKMLEAIPLSRFGSPDDVADVVSFLAGDHSAYITGEVINISGGMVM
ncbi:3-oxoacyl-[acyl-carrier-protein] reductase [Chlorobium phaeovibrioides]|uniref:3-oxoacyl-[acyl-carrier-protein] reductase n=2 Tax=Chlorobium phaeovibrioides TaxID=1094 RepID=A0A432ATW0_CHLPH|nr:3-oxoacyl-[acyl-carrier-protein] reductase [Chlorobium phaeovibrioides]HCD36522.1 3-oxoacyl-[acyl-carrier-protein] reductase [Chlorobium sp.]MWV53466.1 3-oxoacyl-[acyl-carrier-protein] reductase [Chlorobium phaeovibrioides]QEQ57589.1 3-oxoacyl-[acyl-carrier-protein] reductase [Chlorobium phaeovibrioides]RTY34468.1 3-oxoacyl-[acyl-carrier-protein] reductase [Chlorobium phaeovibrioides]RTY36277.1 3-oxoacyl-[acyl-carrier-protein] reductase [Chlorobium phaeovibrioides]